MTEETTRQIQDYALPVSIELERNQKGNYAWTIKVRATDVAWAISEIEQANNEMIKRYTLPAVTYVDSGSTKIELGLTTGIP